MSAAEIAEALMRDIDCSDVYGHRDEIHDSIERLLSGSLDAAWAAVEAVLPEGWWIHAIDAYSFDDMAYRAEAASAGSGDYIGGRSRSDKKFGNRTYVAGPRFAAYGPTPAAALLALAEKLRPI